LKLHAAFEALFRRLYGPGSVSHEHGVIAKVRQVIDKDRAALGALESESAAELAAMGQPQLPAGCVLNEPAIRPRKNQLTANGLGLI
jgi:hypothetical protein